MPDASTDKPDASNQSETDQTVSQQAKQQPADQSKQNEKPDEGIRPGDLTSENDSGVEG